MVRQKSAKKQNLLAYSNNREVDDSLKNTIQLLHPEGNWKTFHKS